MLENRVCGVGLGFRRVNPEMLVGLYVEGLSGRANVSCNPVDREGMERFGSFQRRRQETGWDLPGGGEPPWVKLRDRGLHPLHHLEACCVS